MVDLGAPYGRTIAGEALPHRSKRPAEMLESLLRGRSTPSMPMLRRKLPLSDAASLDLQTYVQKVRAGLEMFKLLPPWADSGRSAFGRCGAAPAHVACPSFCMAALLHLRVLGSRSKPALAARAVRAAPAAQMCFRMRTRPVPPAHVVVIGFYRMLHRKCAPVFPARDLPESMHPVSTKAKRCASRSVITSTIGSPHHVCKSVVIASMFLLIV